MEWLLLRYEDLSLESQGDVLGWCVDCSELLCYRVVLINSDWVVSDEFEYVPV